MVCVVVSTVGLGDGVERAIAKPINAYRPDLAVYLVTENSMKTVWLVEKLLRIKIAQKTVRINDKDDFERCFIDSRDLLLSLMNRGYNSQDIIINFTGGTKPMSGGLLAAALSLECGRMIYVHGKRGENGRVISGTERVMSLLPAEALAYNKRKKAVELFGVHQFDAVIKVIEEVKALTKDPEVLHMFKGIELMAKGYSYFDRFEYEKAMEILKQIDDDAIENLSVDFLELGDRIYKNKCILHKELTCDKYQLAGIANLLENARRRGEEGRYDDAVTRLYRAMEYFAQMRLWEEYGIDSSDIDINLLPPMYRDHYEKRRNEMGNIEVSLRECYRLLNQLGDEVGKEFEENEEVLALLYVRNRSQLAHGNHPISKTTYQKFYSMIKEFVLKYYPEFDMLLEKAKFPEVKA